MALERLSVGNLEALLQALGQRKDKPGGVFLLFCGDVVPESGESWCSDCVKGNRHRAGGVAKSAFNGTDTPVFASRSQDWSRNIV